MPLQIHQWYSTAEIFAAFTDAGPTDVVCDGQFAIFTDAIACLITLGHPSTLSRFTSASRFSWKPQRLNYAPAETIPWFPEVAREAWSADRTQRLKQHHLFATTLSDVNSFYVGPVHIVSYGGDTNDFSATFFLTTVLPRQAWLHFGGSLQPRQPFAALPVAALGSSDMQFHRKTLDLLHIQPPPSAAASARLDQLEYQHQLRLPAAVREWYSLTSCMDIMRQLSLMHTPIDIADFDDSLPQRYAATPPYLSMLPVMFENQRVWHLAVVLDAGDDPPVYLGYQVQDGIFEWHVHAEHFSAFVYGWAWDYVSYERDYILHTSAYMVKADIAQIRTLFQQQATTYWTTAYFSVERIERYVNGDQKITLMIDQEGMVIWFSAETVGSLEALLRGPWSPTNTLEELMQIDLEMQKMYLW